MSPELEALARRAVACKGWRWMAGMLACTDVPLPHFGGAVRLRVVADGKACELVEIGRGRKFLFAEYGVCEVANPGQYDRISNVRVLATGEIVTSERYGVDCQPVRLERWEDEG